MGDEGSLADESIVGFCGVVTSILLLEVHQLCSERAFQRRMTIEPTSHGGAE